MLEYARTAHARGVRVLIAGAGGAAHLPGMVGSQPELPSVFRHEDDELGQVTACPRSSAVSSRGAHLSRPHKMPWHLLFKTGLMSPLSILA